MSRKTKLILICIVSSLVLSGCWNRRELNELAIVLAIGVDKKDDHYIFTAQVVNPSMVAGQEGGFTRTPIMAYRAEGETLFEAWRTLTRSAPRKMYFSHVRIVVLGEQLAKEGFMELLDPILRDHEFRTDYYLMVAREEKASNVLALLTSLEEIPAFKIDKMVTAASENLGVATHFTLDKIVNELKGPGKEPVITSLRLVGNPQEGQNLSNLEVSSLNTKIVVDKLAVVKEGKVIGYIADEDSRGYNYSQGTIKSGIEKLACANEEEKNLVVEIIRSKSKIKAKLKNGKPVVTIHIRADGNIVDVECRTKPQEEKEFTLYEKELRAHLKRMVEEVVTLSQEEFQSDIFGIGEAIHRSEPKYWKKHEKQWPDLFPNTEVKVVVESQLHNIGSINQPPQVKEK